MVYIAVMAAMAMTGEHAQDVLENLATWLARGEDCALVIVMSTEGGAVRAPGALLAVSPNTSVGYISGGCIDADVVFQARAACESREPRALRYGAGSPFVDLPLPCGGAIEVLIVPHPDIDLIQHLCARLSQRAPVSVAVSREGQLMPVSPSETVPSGAQVFEYLPKLKLRIAGRGADALALAKISDAAGYETVLQLLDEEDIEAATEAGLKQIEKLSVPSSLDHPADDPWTAFVLLFHDQDWEVPLLQQALAGPAFYIGAVGSARTHANRSDALLAAGSNKDEIARIHGPIGLVKSLRDASLLAVSTLAEIIEQFQAISQRKQPNTALVMLAAGASTRFENGDKLLADLNGKPVLQHVGELGQGEAIKLAIVPAKNNERASILKRSGWTVLENPYAKTGQSSSLQRALDHLSAMPWIDQIVLLLGDMPGVTNEHIAGLLEHAQSPGVTAAMSECEGVLCPPALFKREHFEALSNLTGDRGAKSVFLNLTVGAETVELSAVQGRDIDCLADLDALKEIENA